MTYTHLRPGNVVKYNSQIWIVTARTRKTLDLVAFNNSKANVKLKSQPPAGTPVYMAENAASYVIGLISDNY